MSLQIYRASAGSGKTFALTEKYLKLLYKNPSDYRHILAVTFTNKATAEMRSRILESLYKLTDETQKDESYMAELKKTFSLSEKQVRERAALCLYLLLHDYSRFSVSTIDSFFQHVIRSFAREVGLSSGFRLEFNSDVLMMQAIDNMIFEIDKPEKSDLKNWLVNFAESRMDEDKNWDFSHEILKISKLIELEIYQENSFELSQKLMDKKRLELYKNQIKSIVSEIDKSLNFIGKKGLNIIEKNGLDIFNDFHGKSRSKVRIFLKMKTLKDFIDETSYLELIDNPEKWTAKGSSKVTQALVLQVFEDLNSLLHRASSLVSEKSGDYFTALAILENLNALGIINDVNLKLNELCHEKNLFLISGANYLLNSIIDNNETPFLYEKTGVNFSQFMIDEFQDTSMLQYKNFIPLIKESLANNNFSMFVGDVKQAIYRWRNSDWNLLAETAEFDFQNYGTEINVLDVNWRSSEEIINFNNRFFIEAPEILQIHFNQSVPEIHKNTEWYNNLENKIKKIYKNVYQKISPAKQGSGGHISLNFFDGNKTENEDIIVEECIKHIAYLIDSGYKKSDICVLVRKNEQGVLITNELLSGKYHPRGEVFEVFSGESLLLSLSEAVNVIVAQLKFIINPDDLITESYIKMILSKIFQKTDNEYNAALLFEENEIMRWDNYKEKLLNVAQLPLYELVESLVNMFPFEYYEENIIYLQSFLSVVHDFVNQDNADVGFFLDFWKNKKESLALSISENEDSINVLTIHKAKGLEFKAVVIPFFSWEIKNRSINSNYLLVHPKSEPFNYLKLAPVKEKKNLAYSHFAQEYFTEIICQYVDNLNLAYVAFTRAKESLSIFANIKNTDVSNIQTVANLLFFHLSNNNLLISNDKGLFSYNHGNISIISEAKDSNKKRNEINIDVKTVKNNIIRERIEFHINSSGYLNDKETENITHGKLMHRIFEKIITKNDVEKSLIELRRNGIINKSTQNTLREFILNKINNPAVSKWFDGSYNIRTESEIIAKNNKRPDRVMFSDNEVIVVDYKFGQIKLSAHTQQVKEYIKLLSEMGYKNIKGYVWYVGRNEVDEVSFEP